MFFVHLPPGGKSVWLDRMIGLGITRPDVLAHVPDSIGLWGGSDLGLIPDIFNEMDVKG